MPSVPPTDYDSIVAEDIQTEDIPVSNDQPSLLDIDPPDLGNTYDAPQSNFARQERKKAGTNVYEKKAEKLLKKAVQYTLPSENTRADAATFLQYGDKAASTLAALAAYDKRVGRTLDFLDGGVTNPYAAAVEAWAPIILQLIRNHEPVLEPAPRSFTLPFGKKKRTFRIPFKFGIRLGFLRRGTHNPDALISAVFSDPDTIDKLRKNGFIE